MVNQQNLQNVVKRNGMLCPFDKNKITQRLDKIVEKQGLKSIDVEKIVKSTMKSAVDKITTQDLDELSMANAASYTTKDPEYGLLASGIAISGLHKMTPDSFSKCTKLQYQNVHPKLGTHCPLISDKHYQMIKDNAKTYDSMIKPDLDYRFDYFGYKTLERSYLKRVGKVIVDRPSYMLMRVAVSLHETKFERVQETYELMAEGYMIHATPTLFNSCAPNQQLASCFLLTNQADSIDGLYNTYKQLAHISKMSGGIGISYQGVRASNSYVKGTNGVSKGTIRFAKIVNDTARAVDQGGKRNGAFSIWTEPWHADVFDFLRMKKAGGDENQRCRDLFPAMWIPDLFFKRVQEKAPGLNTTWGEEFEKLYVKYENTPGLVRETVSARKLYKIHVRKRYHKQKVESTALGNYSSNKFTRISNVQNLNLCCEVAQFASPEEISVCTLGSLALPMFVKDGKFDHQKLYQVTRVLTRNLDIVIEKNNYPFTGEDMSVIDIPEDVLEGGKDALFEFMNKIRRDHNEASKYIKPVNRAERSSKRHRNIGIGVQGLADVFILLGLPFDSEGAASLNKEIFETIYFASLSASNELAKESGPHPSYDGSPVSKGILQPDMWGVTPSDRWDWTTLRRGIAEFGVRNSLLVAPMPTKSTSHILGNNECFEPYHSMIYKARVLAGEFDLVNKHLIRALKERGLWNDNMREKIIAQRGSVQNVEGFPEDLKPIFKNVWEVDMKSVIDMAADRGAFIDQSQSMNLWLTNADVSMIASMILYAWEKGLKTLCYYLHVRTAADALAYTVDPEILKAQMLSEKKHEEDRYQVTSLLNEDSKVLSPAMNPLYTSEDGIKFPALRERMSMKEQMQENEDDDIINTCPYDPKNPNKSNCKVCSS